jgi:hypothetical protein
MRTLIIMIIATLFAASAVSFPTMVFAVDCQAYCAKYCAGQHGSMATFCPTRCMEKCELRNSSKKKK